jgi:hypothetical protein
MSLRKKNTANPEHVSVLLRNDRRTNLDTNNGLNMGIALYTKLPQNLKKFDTKHIFKNKTKKLLLQNVFYSVDEYLLS